MPGSDLNKRLGRVAFQGQLSLFQAQLDEITGPFNRELKIGQTNPSIFISGNLLHQDGAAQTLMQGQLDPRADNTQKLGSVTVILDGLLRNNSLTPLALAFCLKALSYDAFYNHFDLRDKEGRADYLRKAQNFWTPHSKTNFLQKMLPLVVRLQQAHITPHMEYLNHSHSESAKIYSPKDHAFHIDELSGFYNELKGCLSSLSRHKISTGTSAQTMKLFGLIKTGDKNSLCDQACAIIEKYWEIYFLNNLITREELLAAVAATLIETYYECTVLNKVTRQGNHELGLIPHIRKVNLMMCALLNKHFLTLRTEARKAGELAVLESDDFISDQTELDIDQIYTAVQAQLPGSIKDAFIACPGASEELAELNIVDAGAGAVGPASGMSAMLGAAAAVGSGADGSSGAAAGPTSDMSGMVGADAGAAAAGPAFDMPAMLGAAAGGSADESSGAAAGPASAMMGADAGAAAGAEPAPDLSAMLAAAAAADPDAASGDTPVAGTGEFVGVGSDEYGDTAGAAAAGVGMQQMQVPGAPPPMSIAGSTGLVFFASEPPAAPVPPGSPAVTGPESKDPVAPPLGTNPFQQQQQ